MFFKRATYFIFVCLMVIAISVPAVATRYENLNVSNLSVEKTARINGLLQAVANTTGNVWYVDSGSGVDGVGAAGKSQKTPFATVDYAIGRCTANNNDYIIVMAGHAETIAAANGFDADVAGVTILGLGDGTDMPEFTFTATGSTVAVGAANVRFVNLRFLAGVSAIVDGVSIEAAGDNFEMAFCEFPEPTTSTFEFITAINLGTTADYANFHHNTFYNADATGGSHWIEMGDGVNVGTRIEDNLIFGEFLVSAIWSDTADLETLIARNNITNLTTGQHAIEFTAAATGSLVDNLVRTDTQGAAIDPGSMSLVNNLWDDEDTADTVAIPVVAASGTSGSESIGGINDTTTDSLHGKIGTDTEMADNSLYDLLGAASKTDAISDTLAGTAGIATYPAGAAPANAVSLAEVLRDVHERQTFVTVSAVTSSSIPNNTQTAGAITGAAAGALWIEEVVFQCDGTGFAAPTNIELSTDNAKGPTGAGAPIFLEVIGSFGANARVGIEDATSEEFPYYLETGKKVFIHGDDGAGTGAGVCDVIMKWTPETAGATIAGADLP